MADVKLVKNQFSIATVYGQTEDGTKAPFKAGSVQFSTSDESVATIEPNGEEGKYKVVGINAGTATVTFTALNSNDEEITASGTVTVDEFLATKLVLEFSEPQTQA